MFVPDEDNYVPYQNGYWQNTSVGFVWVSDEPFAWARIIQVPVDPDRTLTVRVSCDSIERCALAERVFDSIAIDPG